LIDTDKKKIEALQAQMKSTEAKASSDGAGKK
jgi:hypothetical protein